MGVKKAKVKKTKAEIEAEKLAKEEEERKAKILEDKKQAELNEKKRLEELKLQAERKEFRENELKRLQVEYEQLLNDIQYKEKQCQTEEANEEEKLSWSRYCDPTDEPDAKNERDMNTFISILNETELNEFPETLEQLRRIEKIAIAMADYSSDCLADMNITTQKKCLEYLTQFSNMIVKFFDNATNTTLRFMDKHINEKMEMNIEEYANNAKLGMWVSLNETRLTRKALILEKVGVNLEIPKPFLHHDTRFITRVMRIPIDIFSDKIYLNPSTAITGNNNNNWNSINGNNNNNNNNNNNEEDMNNNNNNVSHHSISLVNSNQGKNSRYYVVGDVIHYDILYPPSQPYTLRAKKWVLREYNATSNGPKKSAIYPVAVPTKCFIKVPDTVIMSDDLRVASWNHELNEWSEEGLTDYQYSEAENIVQFYTTIVGTIAFVKNRVVDFPYKRWSLRPMSPDVRDESVYQKYHEKYVRFTVHTTKHEIVIDVLGTMCQLVRPNIPQVADLIGKKLTPGQLVRKLLSRGINICPVYEDSQYIKGNIAKNEALENDVLRAISRCSSALDFDSSSWNKDLPDSKIGILSRESTISTGGADTYDFECILAEMDSSSESHRNSPDVGLVPGDSGVKYTLVVGNDYGVKPNFSLIPRSQEQTHVILSQSLTNRISDEAKERIERGNERFHHTVYKLLRLVKPFSF